MASKEGQLGLNADENPRRHRVRNGPKRPPSAQVHRNATLEAEVSSRLSRIWFQGETLLQTVAIQKDELRISQRGI